MTTTEIIEPKKDQTEIVKIKTGKIQGYKTNGVSKFKGIPYAEPPIEDLRFRPPVEKKPWSGVLKATEFGPVSLQATSPLTQYFPKHDKQSEDCLTLNVYTPACDDYKRPVIFYIHGGAFLEGGGSDMPYDGTFLAQSGNVVVVTINYRLSALGFLYIPDTISNLGLLDQITALKWVRDNINAFGGDSDNVTICGQSAGGISVTALPAMPLAKGLFHRIIAQSTPFLDPNPVTKNSRTFLRLLKVKTGDIDALRNIPVDQIMDAVNKVCEKDATDVMPFRPVVDGEILPKHPLQAFKDGDCKDFELMIGLNLDDATLFTQLDPNLSKMIKVQGENLMIGFLSTFGIDNERSRRIIEVYKETRDDLQKTLDDVTTDAVMRINTIRLLDAQNAHQSNTYNYMFTWPSPGFGGNLGSCHCIELPFVFGKLDVPEYVEFTGTGPDVKKLSEITMDTWIAFARNGDPNHDGIPEWPAYDSEKRSTMFLGKDCKIVNSYLEKERIAWDGLLDV